MTNKHNDIWCNKYNERVLPNEEGNCSLCDAKLYNITEIEADKLVQYFEDLAYKRCSEDNWKAEDWLNGNEAISLKEARESIAKELREEART